MPLVRTSPRARPGCGFVAARPDESPRGSGPNQWRALMMRFGPNRVSRSISVSLPSHRAGRAPLARRVLPSGRAGRCGSNGVLGSGPHRLIALAGFEQGPDGSARIVRPVRFGPCGSPWRSLPASQAFFATAATTIHPGWSAAVRGDDTHRPKTKHAAQLSMVAPSVQATVGDAVARLRDPAQPLLAAAGPGPGRQPRPCRQITRGLEARCIWWSRRQNAGRNRADCGDRRQTARNSIGFSEVRVISAVTSLILPPPPCQ